MKFNYQVSSFYFAVSRLFMISVVVATDGRQDLDACRRACSDNLHPRLIRLVEPNRVDSEWNDLKPFWSTCQYRCYRCAIPGANIAMDDLEYMFSHNQQNDGGSIMRIAQDIDKADYSFQMCFDKWRLANKNGDTTSTF
jgi:hypothetical protein